MSQNMIAALEAVAELDGAHGLQVVARTGGRVTKGAVYTVLGRMERKGWLVSEKPAKRRIYRITDKGREALAALRILVGRGGRQVRYDSGTWKRGAVEAEAQEHTKTVQTPSGDIVLVRGAETSIGTVWAVKSSYYRGRGADHALREELIRQGWIYAELKVRGTRGLVRGWLVGSSGGQDGADTHQE